MYWGTARASTNLPLPSLIAATFLLQTSRRTGLYWCAWSMGRNIIAFCL